MSESPSTSPRTRKAPQDHKSPVQAEAEGVETVDVTWRDLTFTVPTEVLDWPAEAILAFEEGKSMVAVREGLGPAQFRTLMARKPTFREFNEIYTSLATALGFTSAGESQV